ncbi:hypothetical protein EHW64_12035 [Erwinia psidii]|uniref:hypothetical protein n=1 Tax=Erwinia psidii TaxID=69224 RepID=UPI00226B7172|nr:hypothetical protein [Erwinia psidii]MCX8961838.1 hypothetical protein [Erwinia psidii]
MSNVTKNAPHGVLPCNTFGKPKIDGVLNYSNSKLTPVISRMHSVCNSTGALSVQENSKSGRFNRLSAPEWQNRRVSGDRDADNNVSYAKGVNLDEDLIHGATLRTEAGQPGDPVNVKPIACPVAQLTMSRRNINNTKTHANRAGGIKKNTAEESAIVKGNIGDAQYSLDKNTKILIISAHGMPFGTAARGISSGSKFGDDIIKTISPEHKFNKIHLRSCYGANGGCFSQGQVIADQTGIEVTTYQGKYTQQGGVPFLGSGGKIKHFKPSSSGLQKTINKIGNKIMFYPMSFAQRIISTFRKIS